MSAESCHPHVMGYKLIARLHLSQQNASKSCRFLLLLCVNSTLEVRETHRALDSLSFWQQGCVSSRNSLKSSSSSAGPVLP